MSLLMQALKKAERAKDHHLAEEEPVKPSAAYDTAEALTLSPLELEADPVHDTPRPSRSAPPPPPPPRVRAQKRAMARMEARTVRLAALSGIALLIVAVFGYMYWHAMYGPGSSRKLPMVPMPGLNAPAAQAPAPALVAANPFEGGYGAPVQTAPPPAQPALTIAAGNLANEPTLPDPVAPAPVRTPEPQYAAAPPVQAPRAAPAAEPAIKVARASRPAQVNPALQNGFGAYQRGDMAGARQSYQSVLRGDANNRDALLGMAAVATHDNQPEQAAATYLRLLEIDPNDGDALAGLAAVRQSDPNQAERNLRRVVERQPDAASALFELGNLSARQNRWPEAQQYYFRAYTAAPNNADYAFNLAVGLDRLNQGRLALTYYQRALELAGAGSVGFEREAAAVRVRELGGQ